MHDRDAGLCESLLIAVDRRRDAQSGKQRSMDVKCAEVRKIVSFFGRCCRRPTTMESRLQHQSVSANQRLSPVSRLKHGIFPRCDLLTGGVVTFENCAYPLWDFRRGEGAYGDVESSPISERSGAAAIQASHRRGRDLQLTYLVRVCFQNHLRAPIVGFDPVPVATAARSFITIGSPGKLPCEGRSRAKDRDAEQSVPTTSICSTSRSARSP